MPVARVMSNAERYVPVELKTVTTEVAGLRVTSLDRLNPPRVLSRLERDTERWERSRAAATAASNIRLALGLGSRDMLEHCWPTTYREIDNRGNEIAKAGALVLRCVVLAADGERTQRNIWIDNDHRLEQLTEADIAYTGQIAVGYDTSGGNWTVNHAVGVAGDHLTPRQAMLADEISNVSQFPASAMPEAEGQRAA